MWDYHGVPDAAVSCSLDSGDLGIEGRKNNWRRWGADRISEQKSLRKFTAGKKVRPNGKEQFEGGGEPIGDNFALQG